VLLPVAGQEMTPASQAANSLNWVLSHCYWTTPKTN
jgi:hypothetical protein